MQGQQPDGWGIPTLEAIKRWTPRELWEPYLQISEYDIPIVPLPGADPRYEEVQRLRTRITEILVDKLVRGQLIASGIAVPLDETSRRRDITPELWLCLTFSYRFATVTSRGLTYDHVLVRDATPTSSSTRRTRHSRDAPAQWKTADRPAGRPSIMPQIEAEMRGRAVSGELEASLRREAKVLAAWAEAEFTGVHVPLPSSIERKLGRIYQELNRIKRSDK
jgi:hypothetical protein